MVEAVHDGPLLRVKRSMSRFVATYSLLILAIALFAVFAVILPQTFPTQFNIRSILGTEAVVALLALAVMVPLAAGQYDLSVGYVLGLTSVLAVGLQTRSGLPLPIVVVLVLVVGACAGLLSGVLVTYARIDSFIATLAVGSIAFGITSWYTGGQQIVGVLPVAYTNIASFSLFGYLPLPALLVLLVSCLLYVVLEYLPIGRKLYGLGANPRMAELVGISKIRYTIGAFIVSGVLVGIAGLILGAQLQAGQPDIGPSYLLPAFVGAMLGATSVRPGRVNVWGTITAVLLLAIGIAGLLQLGADFFVQPLFNGVTLAIAVGLAGWASRRRAASQSASTRSSDAGADTTGKRRLPQ